MLRLLPPDDMPEKTWAAMVIKTLRDATLEMLDKLLFFLPGSVINDLYDFCIGILDRLFGKTGVEGSQAQIIARGLIIQIADRVGIKVSFPK